MYYPSSDLSVRGIDITRASPRAADCEADRRHVPSHRRDETSGKLVSSPVAHDIFEIREDDLPGRVARRIIEEGDFRFGGSAVGRGFIPRCTTMNVRNLLASALVDNLLRKSRTECRHSTTASDEHASHLAISTPAPALPSTRNRSVPPGQAPECSS